MISMLQLNFRLIFLTFQVLMLAESFKLKAWPRFLDQGSRARDQTDPWCL